MEKLRILIIISQPNKLMQKKYHKLKIKILIYLNLIPQELMAQVITIQIKIVKKVDQ